MNVCASVLITAGIFAAEVTFAQTNVRTIQTTTHPRPATNPRPSEVKQINNTPVIYIHKQEAPKPGNSNTAKPVTPSTSQPRIRKCQNQGTDADNKKKELKQPVQSNQ